MNDTVREQIRDKLDRMHPYASNRLDADEALEAILACVRNAILQEEGVPSTEDDNDVHYWAKGWNECRQAMLEKLK